MLHLKVTNKEVRKRLNIKTDMMQTIMKRKLGLFGHICRMENSRKIKIVMLGIWMGREDVEDLIWSGFPIPIPIVLLQPKTITIMQHNYISEKSGNNGKPKRDADPAN